jgi:hypothetical protein
MTYLFLEELAADRRRSLQATAAELSVRRASGRPRRRWPALLWRRHRRRLVLSPRPSAVVLAQRAHLDGGDLFACRASTSSPSACSPSVAPGDPVAIERVLASAAIRVATCSSWATSRAAGSMVRRRAPPRKRADSTNSRLMAAAWCSTRLASSASALGSGARRRNRPAGVGGHPERASTTVRRRRRCKRAGRPGHTSQCSGAPESWTRLTRFARRSFRTTSSKATSAATARASITTSTTTSALATTGTLLGHFPQLLGPHG